jgi:pimeloyl-ACP methyl ester carboxylesterase
VTTLYDDALARLAELERVEGGAELNPCCRGYALTHGAMTPRCFVLLHGYTNCPQQFRAFAAMLHERGHSVYVPRLPHHGLADRMAPDQARLSRRDLVSCLDDAIAIAHGLGDTVDVLGLSAGGSLAAYAAQRRPDVRRAVVVAPVLGAPVIPAWATTPLAYASAALPNQFRWWDPESRDERPSPPHCYPRYSTRALGAIVRLGLDVLREARSAPPAAAEIVVVTNAADEAVSLPPIEMLMARWRARGAAVREHRFPAELGLIHDIVDPEQEQQRVEVVYPVLLELAGA